MEKTTGFRLSNRIENTKQIPEILILTDLSSLGIGGQQVHHFNASYQNLLLNAHVGEFRSLSVDWGSSGEVKF